MDKEVKEINHVYILLGLGVGIIIAVVSSVIMFRKGIEHRKKIAEAEIGSAEQEGQRIVSEAEKIAERKKREALFEAREEIHKSRVDLEKEVKERRIEIQRTERRLQQKEETYEKKVETLEKKEEGLNRQIKEIDSRQQEIESLYQQQLEKLENISGLSVDEAKEYLLKNIEGEVKHEAAILVKDIYEKAKEESSRKAKEVLSTAIQRCAVDHSSDITVSVVALPNDEMKGRIIGREGRNIRTLETLTGIDLIIDDTLKQSSYQVLTLFAERLQELLLKSLLPMVEFIQLVSKRWLRKLRKRLRRQFAKRRSCYV